MTLGPVTVRVPGVCSDLLSPRSLSGPLGVLYNTYFSRGGNFRYIREFGFCAKFSSREINIHCAGNFAKFSSREFFLHAKIKYQWWYKPTNMQKKWHSVHITNSLILRRDLFYGFGVGPALGT